ncbi:hypothetical protein [Clostridium sp. C8-1-8]|uniref:hypothetical protein n=1 Tax=Clostridium sp. C8-1-8 TaxID=2698831 RepID=UPI00137032F5|nr:hypothetical protein [Clostridium sp. C8-1-8]
MINVIIYGINMVTIKILNLIDENKCNVSAIISNSKKNIGRKIKEIPIIAPEEINKFSYELIIKAISEENIKGSQAINFKDYLRNYYDFEIGRLLYKLNTNYETIDGFITGLSYAEVGIDEDIIEGNVINAAISSQDIFYDYEVAKYILLNNKYADKVKFAIIGLTYYSFHFDLSKSSVGDRVYSYYPFTNNIHNREDLSGVKCEEFNRVETILKNIFIEDYKNEIYKALIDEYEIGWKDYISGYLTPEKIAIGKENVRKDSLKNYPITVEENKKILNDYIDFLKARNITPYIIICPTSKYYHPYLSERISSEFKSVIEEISYNKAVRVYDYFNSDMFSESDFYDTAHLNRIGARKFTNLINLEVLKSSVR